MDYSKKYSILAIVKQFFAKFFYAKKGKYHMSKDCCRKCEEIQKEKIYFKHFKNFGKVGNIFNFIFNST